MNRDNEEAWSIIKKLEHSIESGKVSCEGEKSTPKNLCGYGTWYRNVESQHHSTCRDFLRDILQQTFQTSGNEDREDEFRHSGMLVIIQRHLEESWWFLLYCVFIGELAKYVKQFHNSSKPLLYRSSRFFKTHLEAKPKLNWHEAIYNYLFPLSWILRNFKIFDESCLTIWSIR